jgi:hypothetical protein
MIWILIVIGVLLLCFGGVLLFGAPYLPTLRPQIYTALDLAELKPGSTLLELGCGDGRVAIVAAQKGIKVIGYELNPLLALWAWVRTIPYRKTVKIVWADFWSRPWPEADAAFVFLLDRYMAKLNKKCMRYPFKPLQLLSFAYKIPGMKPHRQKNGVYLYQYK